MGFATAGQRIVVRRCYRCDAVVVAVVVVVVVLVVVDLVPFLVEVDLFPNFQVEIGLCSPCNRELCHCTCHFHSSKSTQCSEDISCIANPAKLFGYSVFGCCGKLASVCILW